MLLRIKLSLPLYLYIFFYCIIIFITVLYVIIFTTYHIIYIFNKLRDLILLFLNIFFIILLFCFGIQVLI